MEQAINPNKKKKTRIILIIIASLLLICMLCTVCAGTFIATNFDQIRNSQTTFVNVQDAREKASKLDELLDLNIRNLLRSNRTEISSGEQLERLIARGEVDLRDLNDANKDLQNSLKGVTLPGEETEVKKIKDYSDKAQKLISILNENEKLSKEFLEPINKFYQETPATMRTSDPEELSNVADLYLNFYEELDAIKVENEELKEGFDLNKSIFKEFGDYFAELSNIYMSLAPQPIITQRAETLRGDFDKKLEKLSTSQDQKADKFEGRIKALQEEKNKLKD